MSSPLLQPEFCKFETELGQQIAVRPGLVVEIVQKWRAGDFDVSPLTTIYLSSGRSWDVVGSVAEVESRVLHGMSVAELRSCFP